MPSDTIISVENLSKRYRLGASRSNERYTALRDVIADKAKSLFRRNGGVTSDRGSPTADDFWALKDVSFEVKQGEVVGIIGRNGAGKSTLLKILSRITEPTEGRIRIRGRVASLLEVGTGFHPELTGRENIFLNGAILGMHRSEIKGKFDEIVAFAEVEKFLDTPVKRYSSGMYVRLAFAVAAHLEPEILIVDEVLAVGDAEFQKKCLGKMRDVSSGGRTVLFVSHNMQAIRALCRRALLLRTGRVSEPSEVSIAVDSYLGEQKRVATAEWASATDKRNKEISVDRATIFVAGQQPQLTLEVSLWLTSRHSHPAAFMALDIADSAGTVVMQALPHLTGFISSNQANHQLVIKVGLPPMVPDIYFLSIWLGSHNTRTLDSERDILAFEITESPTTGRSFPHSRDHGWIVPQSDVTLHAAHA